MSADSTARKKRTGTEATPAIEGDHRKRRRNRTTQSCLNCHTSKRMCDRKRPACARCTQLGLTGLCVYEVDDPSQRTETQDESSRLLKRVAELEGVIRELKNKPHPRWAQTASPGEDFERWHARSQLPGSEHESCASPSPPTSSSSSERGDSNGGSSRIQPFTKSLGSTFASHNLQHANTDPHRKSPYRQYSPMDTPSPTLLTPTDEYPHNRVGIASQAPLPISQDYELASMFLSYPGIIGCANDQSFSPVSEESQDPGFKGGQCACLSESASYSTMLELSLRLRKASDVLARSPHHQLGGPCQLHRRIAELDSYTTNALADNSGALSDPLMSVGDRIYHPQVHVGFNATRPLNNTHPTTVQSHRGWDMISTHTNSPTPLDDSFMSWEPSRRP